MSGNTETQNSTIEMNKINEIKWDDMSATEKLDHMSVVGDNTQDAKIPFVLIDNSGSTSSRMGSLNILNKEMEIAMEMLTEKNYEQCYLMFWNNKETHVKQSVNVCDIKKVSNDIRITTGGTTDISVAINNIPDGWYQKHITLYIITDGQLNGDKYDFSKQVQTLSKKWSNIHIITVENNSRDYLKDNVNAGSTIYDIICKNKLSKYIRSFECYNNFHNNAPFMNMYNPNLLKGQFSFKEYIFNDKDFNKFANTIYDLICENANNDNNIQQILYHVSFSLYFYTKGKTQRIKNEVVRLFTGLFSEAIEDTEYISEILESEIKTHDEGTTKTYQQYRENRKRLFERTADDLKNNVSACFATGNKFMSFPINCSKPRTNKIIQSNMTNSYVRLGDVYYNNGGIRYGDYHVPMMSVKLKFGVGQPIRQWIRAVYSKTHNIQINDERVMYYLMTDMMSVVLSDLPENVKESYKYHVRIMLQAKRFNTDIKQLVYLMMGNKPKPMIPGYYSMDEIFNQCKKLYNPDMEITNDEFWYGICKAYGYEDLIRKQIPVDFPIDEVVEKLRQYNKSYEFEEIEVDNTVDYKDYITQEDISATGGYRFPDTKFGKKVFKSTILISPTTYGSLLASSSNEFIECPVTGAQVKFVDMIYVSPSNTDTVSYDDSGLDMKIFDKKCLQRVDIYKMDKTTVQGQELKISDSYDFTNYPYEFYPHAPIITEKLYKEREQYRTTEEFNRQVTSRFEWLTRLNMKNVAIAGGFTKSIILNQKVNDIDIYMHGLNSDEEYNKVLERLVTDITQLLSVEYNNLVYLTAYKKEFNVYEMIYFENVKYIPTDNLEVKDLTQMRYITKIQIIMKKHKEPKDIFDMYDIDACAALWDSKNLYMTERSYNAYRYMMSIPRIDKHYTDTFDMRLIKYYKSGFRIMLPRLTIDEIKEKVDDENNLVINKCKFKVNEIEGNHVYIDGCEMIMEKKPKKKGDKLQQTGMSVYDTVIGDIGSIDDSRSIVKFMKYVQRQNRLVDRVKRKLENNEAVDENDLLNDIDSEMKNEMKEKLAGFKLRGRTNFKKDVLLSDSDSDYDSDSDCDADDEKTPSSVDTTIVNNPLIITHKPDDMGEDHQPTATQEEELKEPHEYIRVFYKVSKPGDTRKNNEFENGDCELVWITDYENYHKEKDWYNSNIVKEMEEAQAAADAEADAAVVDAIDKLVD
jgi:hypothetical protein